VGLKPTYGRVSIRGIYPNAVSLDHAGPITRTARDAGLLLGAMAGHDRRDPTSADVPVPDFTAGIDAGVGGLRIALCPDLHFVEIDAAVARALDGAARTFEHLGAKIETVAFPLASQVQPTREAISRGEFLALHRERFAAHPEGYGADLHPRFAEGARVTLDDYVRACRMREAIRRELDEILKTVDALLVPVAPSEAPLIATGAARVNGKEVTFGSGLAMRQVFNVAGLPSVAVPAGFGDAGLPLSMQIVGPAWGEAHVLRIAHAYEVATPELRRDHPTAIR
jgi:aspartyl-tRNA(Asn)/glutamyl-tRNA(Gln) amidotransferase subunit A